MANKKKTEDPVTETPEATPVPVIEPVSITQTDTAAARVTEIEVPAGHVLLVAIDANGNDVAGSDFFYAEKSYKRFYGDETKFRVKKKLN
ncbi:MAG: hypothetical protein EOP51_04030 [Sphingobacteriales bacterium]|nr:MAG: hypothetical protein EOP51_04030 [Sphingobacteriales bacterium]